MWAGRISVVILGDPTGYESLKTYITNLYGEEVHHQIRHFKNLRRRRKRLLSNLGFLIRYRDQGRMPKYLQLRHNIKFATPTRIYHRASKALLQEQIHIPRKLPNSWEKDYS